MIVHNSSSDQSTSPDAQGNLRTIPIQIDPILEKQRQTFRACALTDYLLMLKMMEYIAQWSNKLELYYLS